MRRLRDVFYIYGCLDENYFIYYGMEFKEFVNYNPNNLKNILITDGSYIANGYNRSWCLETAGGNEEISELCKEDIYGLGNFHWIDYNDEDSLNSLTPQEKAEVLYLSHFGKTLNSAFFDKIQNKYVYLAHDDGWFCKLFCKDTWSFAEIIANKIIACFSTNKRRKIYPISDEIKEQLLMLTQEGLLIDFANMYKSGPRVGLRIYTIGKYMDMDEMYNNLERNKKRAGKTAYLEHINKKWTLNYY